MDPGAQSRVGAHQLPQLAPIGERAAIQDLREGFVAA